MAGFTYADVRDFAERTYWNYQQWDYTASQQQHGYQESVDAVVQFCPENAHGFSDDTLLAVAEELRELLNN